MKAVSLFSGGLDSVLATKIILDQGIDVVALHCKTVFWGKGAYDQAIGVLRARAETTGAKFEVLEIDDEYFKIVKHPEHGYGKNLNPCIDCKILIFTLAKKYMEKIKASFLVTGEVLGQRPMSQNRAMLNMIEKKSNTKGILLRPLTAKLFDPTIPEQKKWLDRDKLYDFSGRSRKPQLSLAKKLNIKDFSNPAGGCLLTDKDFSKKMKDLMEHENNFDKNDVEIMKNGRVFRISKNVKLVVGRDERQNSVLENLAKDNDCQFMTTSIAGPVAIGRGNLSKTDIELASSIVAYYSDIGDQESVDISYMKLPNKDQIIINTSPILKETLMKIRI